MFGVKDLIDKLNGLIASGGLTEIELAQAWGAIASLERYQVVSVGTRSELPDVTQNKGRFVWIESELTYVLSDGITWSLDHIVQSGSNLWSWRINLRGQLGNNSVSSITLIPGPVSGSLKFSQVSAGANQSFGITLDGSAWAWGSNFSGTLGDGTTINRSSPFLVVGDYTDWIQSSGGYFHSHALRANGTIWGWGGMYGDNTQVAKSSPVSVVGGFTDWVYVNDGSWTTSAVRANGTMWSWRTNIDGQAGDGTTIARSSPVSVVGGFSDWISVSASLSNSMPRDHKIALRANGTLWSWGNNAFGQLGTNDVINRSSPVSVVGGFTDWTHVSAGGRHSLAIRSNGTLWSWGNNAYGQLGTNSVVNYTSPVSVSGGFIDWTQVSSGSFHNLGSRGNGTLWVWGAGSLGDNTTLTRSSPVSVVGGHSDWVSIASGAGHMLAIRA